MKGILLDENNNLTATNGHLTMGNVTAQCAELLINSYKGEFKNAPHLGGGVKDFMAGNPDPYWVVEIKRQLQENLMPAKSVKYVNGDILIDLI